MMSTNSSNFTPTMNDSPSGCGRQCTMRASMWAVDGHAVEPAQHHRGAGPIGQGGLRLEGEAAVRDVPRLHRDHLVVQLPREGDVEGEARGPSGVLPPLGAGPAHPPLTGGMKTTSSPSRSGVSKAA